LSVLKAIILPKLSLRLLQYSNNNVISLKP